MNLVSIFTLLQLAFSLLVQVQATPNLPLEFKRQAVSIADTAIKVANDALVKETQPEAVQAPISPIPQPAIEESKTQIKPMITFIEQLVITQKDNKEDGSILVNYKFRVDVDSDVQVMIGTEENRMTTFKQGKSFKDNEAIFTNIFVDGLNDKTSVLIGKEFSIDIRHSRREQDIYYKIRAFNGETEAVVTGKYRTKPE